ncbi:conserved hypothetical protein [Leishmania mexicana MHOM/GT/2001/U1103]|uniref:Uncharacterized protein n=1 Tax=Leishmania mexicana (strain MHOM/GT/2001/U1103) TaxID=929439 RepID=E9AJZ2_LEIMU|nr:conserved hypothetical protein [Leishmania mexicana MHOM/GT/2001/U1103]CBZ23242.1 conserved hypothetical protein [Leishmania mexicana MHOM/GT/2001/U1103]
MRRCLTPAGAWVSTWRRVTTVSRAAGYNPSHRPPLTETDANKTTSGASTTAPVAPTSEDYRALLLDLLLYRRETLTPVVEALRLERDEVEKRMEQLDTHVRELTSIRDELRQLAETMLDAERTRLHNFVMDPTNPPAAESTTAAQAAAESGEVEEIVL